MADMEKKKNTSTFELEKHFGESGYSFVVGVDEVGRGPLCGPVVACAAVLKDSILFELDQEDMDPRWNLIRDSKTVSEKQREKSIEFILEHFHVAIGICDHNTIDRINILEASFLAMKKAIQKLVRIKNQELRIKNGNQKFIIHDSKCIILVDGNKVIPNFSMTQKAIVGGDKFVKSISAASIFAKVTRDRMMREFAVIYPGYGIEKHMGYGTKVHMEAIERIGPCEIHRKSFSPVRKALKKG